MTVADVLIFETDIITRRVCLPITQVIFEEMPICMAALSFVKPLTSCTVSTKLKSVRIFEVLGHALMEVVFDLFTMRVLVRMDVRLPQHLVTAALT